MCIFSITSWNFCLCLILCSHRMALAAPVAMETTSLPGTGITGTVKPSEGQANKMAAGSKEAAEEDTEKEASTKKSKRLD